MVRFIFLTFGFMAFAFYQLSGGASFDPVAAREAAMQARLADDKPLPRSERRADFAAKASPEAVPIAATAAAGQDDAVTRVSLNLTSLRDVLGEVDKPAPRLPAEELVKPAGETPEQAVILPSIVFNGSLTESAPAQASPGATIRTVAGSSVNVRGGPGTNFAVVNQLGRGDAVEILQDDGSGWVQMRPVNGGPAGWMADFLLADG